MKKVTDEELAIMVENIEYWGNENSDSFVSLGAVAPIIMELWERRKAEKEAKNEGSN